MKGSNDEVRSPEEPAGTIAAAGRDCLIAAISEQSEPEDYGLADSPPLARSQQAYERDLPELLAHHDGKWVAYADGQRVRFGETQVELYRHCLNELKLTHDRFVVRRVMPECSLDIEHSLR